MTAGFTQEWFGEPSQAVLARLVGDVRDVPGLIVEIGAWEGRSTCALARAAFPRLIDTCDTWQGSPTEISGPLAAERDVRAQWAQNVEAFTSGNVVEHRMGWREYVPTITEPIALCFIDAEHSYIEVLDNIRAVLPLMAPGGIICGDDVHHKPVQQAVIETLGAVDVEATLWVFRLPAPVARDTERLSEQFPELAPSDIEWSYALAEIAPAYTDYVTNVSAPEHAVSHETAAYLHHLCNRLKPAKALDLGSGFSSWVLRQGCNDVTSVDDNPEWAAKTEAFIGATVTSWEQHLAEPGGPYDIIFVDLANGDLREDAMIHAVPLSAPGGVIVFDDTQHPGHLRVAQQASAFAGLKTFTLARTLDCIGRFATLGVRSELGDAYSRASRTPSDINEHLGWFVDCVRLLDAKNIIELGSRSGVSTTAWLWALRDTGGRLTTVDLDAAPPIGTWPNWKHIQGNDMDPDVIAQLEPADIVFLDTSHLYLETCRELNTYRWLVKPGGVLVCHDSNVERFYEAPDTEPPFAVRKAIEEFIDETGFDKFDFLHCNGLTVIKVV